MPIPKFDDLFNPVLQAIKKLGGSASIAELDEEVIKNLTLTEEEASKPHGDRGTDTEVEYRLAWARTYLKGFGLLDNSGRGVWVLTAKGKDIDKVDPRQVKQYYLEQRKDRKQRLPAESRAVVETLDSPEIVEVVLERTWKEQMLAILREMSPSAFERLAQRLLRESGFTQVKVTGQSGDGGIDGIGRVQLGGLLSFPILFQCKRYQGSVGPGVIRDFRGAMIGRADRGLVITTGTFSREAKLEATRDGAPPIDLVDGEQLVEKLKELRLGVMVRMIEEVTVLPDWFKEI